MFSIFQLDRRRKIAEIKIAVLVNILCVSNSTQWNKFAQLKKRRASSPQHAVLWWDVVIEFVEDDPLEWSVTLTSVFWKIFVFAFHKKGF